MGNASGTNTGCPVLHSFVSVRHMPALKKLRPYLAVKNSTVTIKELQLPLFHSILSPHPLVFEERVPSNKFI